MGNQAVKNLTPDQAELAQRGYAAKAPELPPLKRGAQIAPAITSSWFESIQELAGNHKDDYSILNARQAHRTLVDGLDAIDALRQKRNPNDTASSHLAKIEKSANMLKQSAAQKIDKARAEINTRKAKLQSDIVERLGLNTTSPQTEEIRSILRSMDDKKRAEVIANAIGEGDKTILSAVWNAHPVTLGVDAKYLDGFKQRAIQTHAADLMQFEKALDKAEMLMFESYLAMEDSLKNVAGDPKTRSDFERQAQEAEAAQIEFIASLSR